MFAVDILDAIVLRDGKLGSRMIQLLQKSSFRDHAVLFTDLSVDELNEQNGTDNKPGTDFPNVVAERGMFIKFDDQIWSTTSTPERLPVLFQGLRNFLGDGQEVFSVRKRSASYTISYDPEYSPPFKTWLNIIMIMHCQAANSQFILEQNGNVADLVHCDLSKSKTLEHIKSVLPNDDKMWVACGGPVRFDWRMLDVAGKGIAVGTRCGDHPFVKTIEQMMYVFEWFVAILDSTQ